MRARIGHHKAVFAVAHQILVSAYTMLKRGEDYRDMGADYFDRREKPRVVNKLVERLSRLGYYVTLQPADPEMPIMSPPAEPPHILSQPSETTATMSSPKRKPGRPCKCAERGVPCPHKQRIPDRPENTHPTEDRTG